MSSQQVYFLSDFLANGSCIMCMTGRCNRKESHGEPFPQQFCQFIQNPTKIRVVDDSIKKAKLDFGNKKAFFTTCNYVNGNCRNCESGRTKMITINNQKITICYPDSTKIKHQMPVGLHCDFKLVLKGNNFDISILPFQQKKIQREEPVTKIVVQDTTSLTEQNFPTLSGNVSNTSNTSSNMLDFKQIKDSMEKENNEKEKFRLEEEQKRQICPILYDSSKKTSNDDSLLLIKKINDLQKIIKLMEEKNNKNEWIIKNSTRYDDIYDDMKSLNTIITEQYLSTNFGDYLLA